MRSIARSSSLRTERDHPIRSAVVGKRSKTASPGPADTVPAQVFPFRPDPTAVPPSARGPGSGRRFGPARRKWRVQPFRERRSSCTASPPRAPASRSASATARLRPLPRGLSRHKRSSCFEPWTMRRFAHPRQPCAPGPDRGVRAGLAQKWRSSTVRRRAEPVGAPGGEVSCEPGRQTGCKLGGEAQVDGIPHADAGVHDDNPDWAGSVQSAIRVGPPYAERRPGCPIQPPRLPHAAAGAGWT